ncbi:DUF721 domain-containing protein [bacterium]|nr:DUF721 domain-containing protein [bacterium]
MEKILYTRFKYVDDIIAKLAEKAEIKKAITRSNLCKFWTKVAGEKFAQNSKPYSMLKGSVMVIACKTPTVAQELMLKKTQLLVKFQPYTESLHIKIKDLKFDPQKWIDNG